MNSLTHLCLPGVTTMSRCSSGHKCTFDTSLERRLCRWKCWWSTRSNASAHRQFRKIPYSLTQLERHWEYRSLILFDIVEYPSVHPLACDRTKIRFLGFGYSNVRFFLPIRLTTPI